VVGRGDAVAVARGVAVALARGVAERVAAVADRAERVGVAGTVGVTAATDGPGATTEEAAGGESVTLGAHPLSREARTKVTRGRRPGVRTDVSAAKVACGLGPTFIPAAYLGTRPGSAFALPIIEPM
jgi:hypothetical protein